MRPGVSVKKSFLLCEKMKGIHYEYVLILYMLYGVLSYDHLVNGEKDSLLSIRKPKYL